MTIQNAILQYIETNGIKQIFLAEKCKWSKQRVHCMLHGKQNMTVGEYSVICDALGVPYDYFFKILGRTV